jgi:cytosine/uracil/thiamine/allantoin permease
MLGIVFLYYVWKRFSELAVLYGKSKHCGWFGIITYVGSVVVVAFLLGFFVQLFNLDVDLENSSALSLMEIPFGLLSCYLMYLVLEKKWKSEFEKMETIDDIGKSSQEEDSIH